MKSIVLFAVVLMGCAVGEPGNISDAGPSPTHTPEGGLCCQIIHNDSTDPYWHNKRWPCDNDPAALHFPWVCNSGSNAETTCEDTACQTGSTCLGVGGTGLVVDCDTSDWTDW